jgi:hypothetical protein
MNDLNFSRFDPEAISVRDNVYQKNVLQKFDESGRRVRVKSHSMYVNGLAPSWNQTHLDIPHTHLRDADKQF